MSHPICTRFPGFPPTLLTFLGLLLLACFPAIAAEKGAEPLVIPLEILEPPGRDVVADWPVTVGVVLPRGSLAQLSGAHLTEDGVAIPYDAEITGFWPPDSSSIKWVLLRFKATTDRDYSLVLAPGPATTGGPPLAVETKTEITIDTGVLKAVISKDGPDLFETLEIAGLPQLEGGEAVTHSMTIVDDDPQGVPPAAPGPATFEHVTTVVEANTDLRVAAHKTGTYRWDGRDIARLDVRYELYKDEAFVRIFHTVTWLERTEPSLHPTCDFLVEDVSIRASDVALTFPFIDYSRAVDETNLRVGFAAPVGAVAFDLPGDSEETVIQATAGSAIVKKAGGSYPNLAGWLAVDLDGGSRQSGIVVRDLWQTYPKLVTAADETLRLSLWSDATGAAVGDAHRGLSFDVPDILPEDAWWWWAEDYDPSVPQGDRESRWAGLPYVADYFDCSGESPPEHFVHEWFDISVYEHSGQGVARTHELVLNFLAGAHGRSIEEVNSLVQAPVAMRQSPASAMAVPFRGMSIPPVSQEPEHADLERAVDQVGRFTLARWQSLNDYGVWRYGKTRFHVPSEAFNRWYDNMQYDQQEVPLLLWMRGGDRDFFEEGHTLSRYAIELNFNHYTTVPGASPGSGAGAAGLPIPWNRQHVKMETKFTFLALYYHLTGYRPALEIFSTATRSLLDELEAENPGSCLSGGGIDGGPFGRGLYNTFGLLLTAYEEKEMLDLRAGDPELIECWLGATLSAIKTREYREFFEAGNPATAQISSFRSPHYFLLENLVHFQDLAPGTPLAGLLDDAAGDLGTIMLDALEARGWPGLGQPETGLVPAPNFTNYAAALGWAFDETRLQDPAAATEIAALARDLARRTRDSVPDFPQLYEPGLFISRADERGVYPFQAFQAFHELLLPMLVGTATAEAAAGHGIDLDVDPSMADLFVHSAHPLRQLWVESRAAETLRLELSLRDLASQTSYVATLDTVEVRVFRQDGATETLVATGSIQDTALAVPPAPPGASAGEAARQDRFWQPNPHLATSLSFDGIAPGTRFRVELTDPSGAPIHRTDGDQRSVFVGAAAMHTDGGAVTQRAGLVHDLTAAVVPKFAGAYSGHLGGATLFTRVTEAHPEVYTTASTMTLRDAATWQFLDRMPMYRPEPAYPSNVHVYQTDQDVLDGGNLTSRMVALTFSGEDHWVLMLRDGYVRFASATRDDWFDPAAP